jgi:hypothetical protein
MKAYFKTEYKIQVLVFIVLTLLLASSYYPLLSRDPVTSYDDSLLIRGVENLSGISDYQERFLKGRVLDIQPIRDLSYFLDLKLKSVLPFHSFHLTNLFLWIGICYFFKSILDLLSGDIKKNQWLIWSLVFLYAFAPVFTSSVAWISGRKHLLSTFFTLWATVCFLRKKDFPLNRKNLLKIIFLYFLAAMSQPINILWPAFVIAFSYVENKINERKMLILLLSLITIIVITLNLYYYGTLYETISGGDGKHDSNVGAGLSLLALGRYYYLTLFPFDALPVSHYQGSWENLAGLTLLVGSLFYIYKRRIGASLIVCFIIYFFIPLIPVTYKITRIFCSDTYLLNAAIGVYIVIFLILKNIKSYYPQLIISIYALFLFILNFNYIKTFVSTENIWLYSYRKEATPVSISNLAANLLQNEKYIEAKVLIDQLEIMDPDNRFFIKLKSDLIYNNPVNNDNNKVTALQKLTPKAPIVYLRLALLSFKLNKVEEFRNNIDKLFSDPQGYIKNSYLRNEELLALVRVACEQLNMATECKKKYDSFGKHVTFNEWNPELYKAFYYQNKKHPEDLTYK